MAHIKYELIFTTLLLAIANLFSSTNAAPLSVHGSSQSEPNAISQTLQHTKRQYDSDTDGSNILGVAIAIPVVAFVLVLLTACIRSTTTEESTNTNTAAVPTTMNNITIACPHTASSSTGAHMQTESTTEGYEMVQIAPPPPYVAEPPRVVQQHAWRYG